MKRILKITFTIILISFTSCEKSEVEVIEKVAKGTINATKVYTGSSDVLTWVTYFICDINLLDVVSTMITQMNTGYMNGTYETASNIGSALGEILEEQAVYKTYGDNISLSRDMDPGTYILVARHRVQYNYPNTTTTFQPYEYQYKITDVQSNETTYVVFVFEDHVSDAEVQL